MASLSGYPSAFRTLNGLININATSARIGDIVINNDTISGVDTIYFQDGTHSASVGLDPNGDLLIDGTGELRITTDGVNMEGETLNMNNGEIHNVPLIHSRNNQDITIEGKGSGDIILKTANTNRLVVLDTGVVQVNNGLSVSGQATFGNILSSGIGTYAGVYGTTLQATTATFGSAYTTTLGATIGSFSGLSSTTFAVSGSSTMGNIYSSGVGTFAGLRSTTLQASTATFTTANSFSMVANQGFFDRLSGSTLSVSGASTMGNIFSTGTGTFSNLRSTTIQASSATFNNIQMDPIAIGVNAGLVSQKSSCIAIGVNAGSQIQSTNAIAIGESAGMFSQQSGAIAIGTGAGFQQQGTNSIAIGNSAGDAFQHQNTIILNATNSYIDSTTQSALYIAPLRNQTQSNLIGYNTSTYEVSYFPTSSSSFTFGGLSCSTFQATTATFGSVNANTMSASNATLGQTNFTNNVYLSDKELRLRSPVDANHALRYCGTSTTFASQNLDGPVLYGFANGGLGTTNGGEKLAFTWNSNKDASFNGWLTIAGRANYPSVQDNNTLQLGGGIKFNNTNFYPTLTGNNYSHMYIYSGRRDPCTQFTVPLPIFNAGGFVLVSYYNVAGNWASAQGVCRANAAPALQQNGTQPGIQGYWNGGQSGIVFFGTAVQSTGYVCVVMFTDGQFD